MVTYFSATKRNPTTIWTLKTYAKWNEKVTKGHGFFFMDVQSIEFQTHTENRLSGCQGLGE